ncbi:MAG: glutamate--tRNA ligase [Spirochaetes bacterium GWD1_61_31]|nr:MAG: glutamate--tRNA ligase [Spirochaetes bacterium GWB1_60_80]OHD32725.1 MAG: glutamate--tRNA ligase [Spirochaetes bacterium GWC1_61_12]OHD44075.1 MAG: glutamate--tRNA ligase [Spirochaetes bacterium GWD1_61_31]OHD46654.1 MAG: glutamate--tRNA ligase [Spirochaetes bacterium GWE1_60_18]OHD61530.1 MAG: glutamate--tRNA ligase [Spirochaetes bacterium GWF1_60_12]HAP44406.1 glutamate--tRNA ligase [Spirochaetaceae bacterium]
MSVRVRYAPSPTGLQHIGGVRTALFNYLFARSMGGSFILRLEDTDRSRSADRYVQNLYDTFKWLGFYWDEGPDVGGAFGPYVQSERFALYKEYAQRLIDMDKAYYCFCGDAKTADKLANKAADQADDNAEEAAQAESGYGYNRRCRSIDPAEAKRRVAAGEPHVIRLKIPLDGTTSFTDLLLGEIEWKNADVNPDPVLLKSDGFPTYHLANVVDDHTMQISHVMRAQEWIPSAPLHLLMYQAFGWQPPKLCHLPMVLGQDGQKLSKRHGATAVDEFRTKGYLKDALINYVAMLGCSYQDGRDLYSLSELVSLFKLEHINKAPAIFDYVKLEWFNGQYIRALEPAALAGLLAPLLAAAGLVQDPPTAAQRAIIDQATPLVRERLKYLTDVAEALRFLFTEPVLPPVAELLPKKLDAAATAAGLAAARQLLVDIGVDDHDRIEAAFRAQAEALGCKLGDLLMPLRLAVTGTKVSPPLFESIHVLGVAKALPRIDKAIAALRA